VKPGVGFVFVSKNWQIHSPSGAICSPSAHFDFSSVQIDSPRSQMLRLMRFSPSERGSLNRASNHKAGQRRGIGSLKGENDATEDFRNIGNLRSRGVWVMARVKVLPTSSPAAGSA
jgi:hypothetical protein